jgi:hypothetical protein
VGRSDGQRNATEVIAANIQFLKGTGIRQGQDMPDQSSSDEEMPGSTDEIPEVFVFDETPFLKESDV